MMQDVAAGGRLFMLSLVDRYFVGGYPDGRYMPTHLALLIAIAAAGTWLRFWGLGNVGLHGDEETMAMAAMAILNRGSPHLPSGMLYLPGFGQLYMMAGSVWLFGQSEWALRFPSAVVGSLAIVAAFFMGRRFLSPAYNVAFVATIAFLPSMIEISQTARMYVFLVTLLIVFAACVFRWERDQKLSSLSFALLVMVLALSFHRLSIFATPLFLFPALTRQSRRQLIEGGAAMALAAGWFLLLTYWQSVAYPATAEMPPAVVGPAELPSGLSSLLSGYAWLILVEVCIVAGLAAALGVALARSGVRPFLRRILPGAAILAGLSAMAFVNYYVGAIAFGFGVIGWLRERDLSRRWLTGAVIVAVLMAAVNVIVLSASGAYHGREIIGALVGQPSVWPVLRMLQYAPAAAVLFGLAAVIAVIRLAHSRRVPMVFLFFAIAVWAPLFAIGYFRWNVPPRYTQGQIVPFLLATIAGVRFLEQAIRQRARLRSVARQLGSVMAGAACLVLVNPIALARAVPPGYSDHPDHKGAAEFIEACHLKPGDIVIAEDVLEQTYYLGKVDYWLRDIDNARHYLIKRGGRLVDEYTATPVLGTGAALTKVLDRARAHGHAVYIIGNAEALVNGKPLFRRQGIAQVFASGRLEVVYVGRDKKTKVWKLVR